MRKDSNYLNEQSRSDMRAKRRKTNIILNTAIALVLLLIIFASIKIFFSDDEKASDSKTESVSTTVKSDSEKKSSESGKSKVVSKEKNTADVKDEDKQKNSKDDVTSEDIEDQQIVTDGPSNSEVKKTIVNPAWKPIGTTQSSGPAQDYSMDGVDWKEMVQAISYAAGFDEGNGDVLQRLENNGPKKAVGIFTKKDTQQIYRVYIEWVNGEGWKPTLVEELSGVPSSVNQ